MAKRRASGEGTIYYDKVRDLWVARYVLPDGRRPAVSARTQAVCLAKLDAAKRDRDRGMPKTDNKVTVGALMDYWLEHDARGRVNPKTLASYRSHVETHIRPALGRVRLASLKAADVQRFLNGLAAAGKSRGTVLRVRAVLRRALAKAEAWDMVGRNVASMVDPPPGEERPATVPTPAEVLAILAAFKGHPLEPHVTVAVTTGLRQGELLALHWDAVDLDACQLTVRQSLYRVPGGGLTLKEPKTKAGRRTIDLSDLAVAALRQQRAAQNRARLAAGDKWQESAFVFTSAHGAPLDGTNVYSAFRRQLKAAGLPGYRWHDLRHACCSLMINAGAAPREVMEHMGHSDIRVTMNRYGHIFPATRRETASRIDQALAQAAANPS